MPVQNNQRSAITERGLLRRVFCNADNRVRVIWLLALSLTSAFLVSWLVRRGLSSLFEALFGVWGVDAMTVVYAPAWVRGSYRWHTSAIAALVSLAGAAICLPLQKAWQAGCKGNCNEVAIQNSGESQNKMGSGQTAQSGTVKTARLVDPKETEVCDSYSAGCSWMLRLLIPAGMGLCLVIVSYGLFILLDSMRLDWPLSEPRFTVTLPVLMALNLLAAWAEDCFSKRVIYDGLEKRAGGAWAIAASTSVFFIANGGWSGTLLSGINVVILGLLCCMIYARYGLAASVGFRWGWSCAGTYLTGINAADAGIYSVYHVSEELMTGGDAGIIYGLWATICLLVLLLVLSGPGRLWHILRGLLCTARHLKRPIERKRLPAR